MSTSNDDEDRAALYIIAMMFVIAAAVIGIIIGFGVFIARDIIFKYSRSVIASGIWLIGHLAFFGHMIFIMFIRDKIEGQPMLHYDYPDDYLFDVHPAIAYLLLSVSAVLYTIFKYRRLTAPQKLVIEYEELLCNFSLKRKGTYIGTSVLPNPTEKELLIPEEVFVWHSSWQKVARALLRIFFRLPILSAVFIVGFHTLNILFGLNEQHFIYVYLGLGSIVFVLGIVYLIELVHGSVELRHAKPEMLKRLRETYIRPQDKTVLLEVVENDGSGGMIKVLRLLVGAVVLRSAFNVGKNAAKGLM